MVNLQPERDILDLGLRAEFEKRAAQVSIRSPVDAEGTVAPYFHLISEDDAVQEDEWILHSLRQLDDIESEYDKYTNG